MRYAHYATGMAVAIMWAASGYEARAQGSGEQPSERAVIELANLGGIRDWRPAGSADAILIEGRNGQWYRATFMNHCPQINFHDTLGFVTDATGDLTRFSSVMAGDQRCYFRTFERTAPPDEMPEAAR